MKEPLQWQETHYGDCAHRPDMHGILIPGKRGRLLSVLYTAAGGGSPPRFFCSTASPAASGILTWRRRCVGKVST